MESDPKETRPKASTEDVLGTGPERSKVSPRWQKHYQRLNQLRTYLREKRGDLIKDAQEEQPAFSLHMADAGTDEYDMNFALAMLASEQEAIYEIEQAMTRILDGTYGICERTGKPIDPERLEAIPWTRFSKEAEEQLEREGQAPKPTLGEAERVTRSNTSGSVGQQGVNTKE